MPQGTAYFQLFIN